MNRRKFLKILGITVSVGAIIPFIPKSDPPKIPNNMVYWIRTNSFPFKSQHVFYGSARGTALTNMSAVRGLQNLHYKLAQKMLRRSL